MEWDPCARPVRAGIATRNPGKIIAARRTLASFCNVRGLEATTPPPGLPAQPVGREVFAGALARAYSAWREGFDFGIGVEAGPIEFYTGTGFIEVQVAVIVGPGERASVGVSQGFELPPGLAARVIGGEELGSLVSRPGRDIGESIGYIGLITSGRVTRVDLTTQALIMALTPWISSWWRELPTASQLASTQGLRLPG